MIGGETMQEGIHTNPLLIELLIGFCSVIISRLMSLRNDRQQEKLIAQGYHMFIGREQSHLLHSIMNWAVVKLLGTKNAILLRMVGRQPMLGRSMNCQMRQQQGQSNRAHGQLYLPRVRLVRLYLPRVRLVRLESLSLEISYLGVKSAHLYKDGDCIQFN